MGKPVRVVLVGCGGISNGWWNAVKDRTDVEIVGLVDLNEENARRKRDEWSLQVPTFSNLAEALGELGPEAVFDCTIPAAHKEVTLTSLAHGCHVMGEKPLADSMANARAAVAAAKQADLTYAVIQNRRFSPAIRSFRSYIESGAIGDVTTVNSDFYIGAHFGGFRDAMEHVLLLDMAIHSFDQARLITGEDPVSVYCHEWNPKGSWYAHGASAMALFEMTNGVVYTYRGSWCAEGLNTSWQCNWRVQGSTGAATWDGEETFAAQRAVGDEGFFREQASDTIPLVEEADKNGGHAGVINDFLRSIRDGGTPETICTDNIKSLAMVFGAIESAKTGKKVPIEI